MPSNAAEEIFRKVLQQMIDSEEIIVGSLRIVGFLKNAPNDRLDEEGIDFLVFLNNGLALSWQIKTLKNKLEQELLSEHLRKHPLVKFLTAVDIYSNDFDKIRRDIKRSIRSKIRKAISR